MNDLFGLSMTYVMIALLVILGIAASSIAWVVLRNRVMFLIGVRNIPRRRAQTVLIIIGLMLSTLIISTAFSIGDTVSYSLTSQVYERLHSVDEVVHTATDQSGTGGDTSLVTTKPIPGDQARSYVARFKAVPGVDGALSIIRTTVPIANPRTRLHDPKAGLVGAAPGQMQGFETDIQTLDGRQASLDALGPNEIYANKALADKLDVVKGDTLQIFVSGQSHTFKVRDIVQDRVLAGALLDQSSGVVLGLPAAQTLLGRPDNVDLIVVSNNGGVHAGINNSGQVKDALNAILAGSSWSADATLKDLVKQANTAASFLTTFFVVLGLFSIAAGALLIFLIFVMLAAERKVEMGMIRAVGTKRSHLVQMFMSEGMAYNTAAAAVGCALGVVVSIGMVRIMASLFAGGGLGITFHVTARSLIVSYSLGVVLTFLTVTFSSWRIGNLNIVSAIRDTADPTAQVARPRGGRGILTLLTYAKWIIVKPERLRDWIVGFAFFLLAALLIALTAGSFIGAVAIYGSTAAASVAAVLLGVLGVCAAIASVVAVGIALTRIFQTGAIALIVGGLLVAVGLISWQAAAYTGGTSLVFIGAALTLVMLRVPARPVFTTMGLSLLVYWLLSAGRQLPPHMNGGIEMFFLSGITMVLSSTFVLIYNADVMLAVLTRVGSLNAGLVPAIRTAVAYPLANKFRTGMTIAMISLVMFALVMISTMNSNFSRIFLSNDALGGYDVVVQENPNNPIPDLTTAIQRAGGDAAGVASVDVVHVANPIVSEVRMAPAAASAGSTSTPATPAAGAATGTFSRYMVLGPSDAFINGNGIKFHARADGLTTDAQVWHELLTNPNAAVIDAFAIGGGGFGGGGGFTLTGIKPADTTFKPIKVQVRDAANPANIRDLEIVGIFSTKASAVYHGLYVAPPAFAAVFPKPDFGLHFVKVAPGVDSTREAKYIEATLSSQGVQSDSLRKLINDQRAQNQAFLYLIQGFMGIGLFVGIAAVGVIAFRTVVERRQQIGMMRALGYTRRAVAVSFIMESSFIALLGILSGIGLGLLLAYQLLQGDSFAGGAIDSFYIPWLQILAIGGFAFIASLLMTIIPSRQASSIPIAEALRYE
ncbi:MAG TPA: FtsX-like permease family protein [Dehalococcoidia bacterium]|nr:FtsX-like permease family protein [Dehalococcoidia bacterium]